MQNRTFTDQLNRQIALPFPPKRIISLVPSQTELLYYLGLEEEVVGITKFCVHPEKWFRSKQRIGGTKTYHLDRIDALKPDLIIANKEENDQAQVEALAEKYPVWISDIKNLDDALDMINRVGALVGKPSEADILVENIQEKFANLPKQPTLQTAVYFIWREPYMVAGGDTFINEMMRFAGFKNLLEEQERYPEITLETLVEMNPEVILLSSEPFPFKEKHIADFKAICPNAVVELVDGELYSWYGNRLLNAANAFEGCP
ncbi:MAG: ABC-type Fe3+-hydroxamate transport system substrate-binding protein [Paraglaciecola sp.]|jgi:ABC-type Fe3+-hydroxamate transport system substrate-binding protein